MSNKYYTKSKEGFVVYEYKNTICLARCGTPSVDTMDKLCKSKDGVIRRRVWFRDTVNKNRHYLDTGIDGSYEAAELHDSVTAGKEIALFDDTEIHEQPDGLYLERKMMIEGKRFAVRSVFAGGGSATPIGKLLSAIDNGQ